MTPAILSVNTEDREENMNNNLQMEQLLQHVGAFDDLEDQWNRAARVKKPLQDCRLVDRLADSFPRLPRLVQVWGPCCSLFIRLLLVATFVDDSLRTVAHFPDHVTQVGEQGCLSFLEINPRLVNALAALVLTVGVLTQWMGSTVILVSGTTTNGTSSTSSTRMDVAIKALIGWTCLQPILYLQLSNMSLVAESLSLVGGLLLLRGAQQHSTSTTVDEDDYDTALRAAKSQFYGRLLLPATYVYYTGVLLRNAFTYDETTTVGMYLASLSLFVVHTLLFVGLLLGTLLVATGLKSRLVALLLGVINLGVVFGQHAFFTMISYKNMNGSWEWVYDPTMSMPQVTLPDNVNPLDFEASEIYDLHKYYFFLGLSTSGALFLLAQHGPGAMSVQRNEVLLPTVRD